MSTVAEVVLFELWAAHQLVHETEYADGVRALQECTAVCAVNGLVCGMTDGLYEALFAAYRRTVTA